jgi:hypothetical protein
MAYNNILDYTNTEVGYINGPITVSEAQAFCRMENTTTAQDSLFALWIRAARTKVEQYTGLSLIPRSIVAVLTVPQGNMELPFGPVTGTPTFVDEQGVIQTITTRGLSYPFIVNPVIYTKATYTAGYADGACPDELQEAMLLQIAFWWENRGDQSQGGGPMASNAWCPETISICQKWKRKVV